MSRVKRIAQNHYTGNKPRVKASESPGSFDLGIASNDIAD